MTSLGSCYSCHYSITPELSSLPRTAPLVPPYHALSPWAGDRTRISLLRLFCDHFSFRLSSWPSHLHTYTNTCGRMGRLCIYMRYLCGRMWACAIYAHVSISAWDVNWIFYYHIPKYAQKWMSLWPHLLDGTARRQDAANMSLSMPNCLWNIFQIYIYTHSLTNTHLATHSHTLRTDELLYKEKKDFS